nr:hypothetical protein GCM10020093_078670 [Planobispora longispora]
MAPSGDDVMPWGGDVVPWGGDATPGRRREPGHRMETVPVRGGDLRVGVWGDRGPLVVAAHGITSSHMAWTLVGPELGGDHRFVAVDLRGRGGSRDLPAPYGMAAHADDLAAVIRRYGAGPPYWPGTRWAGSSWPRPPGATRTWPTGWSWWTAARRCPCRPARATCRRRSSAPWDRCWPGCGGPSRPGRSIATCGARIRRSPTGPRRAPPTRTTTWWRRRAWGAGSWRRAAWRPRSPTPRRCTRCPASSPAPAGARRFPPRGPRHAGRTGRAAVLPGRAAEWLPGVAESTVDGVNHYTITLGPVGSAAVVRAVRSATAGRL